MVENQISGYTFRFIEEMLPMMKQGQLEFVANNDKIRKSVDLVDKGVELRNLEKYNEAVACYNEALEIYPENSSAWSSLGVILRILGKPEESISYYDKALGFDSGDIKEIKEIMRYADDKLEFIRIPESVMKIIHPRKNNKKSG